jgi:hypothetical protein
MGSGVTYIGGLSFNGCSGLRSIKYKGTKAQWDAITKENGWDRYTGGITVTFEGE